MKAAVFNKTIRIGLNGFLNGFPKSSISHVNPLRPSAESCSDWAEIFRVDLFIYLKNILFYALIFYLALLKIIKDFVKIIYGFFYSALGRKYFQSVCSLSPMSLEPITV
jgi:hypothetical protein